MITISLHPALKRVLLGGKQAYVYGCLVLARDEQKEPGDINAPFMPAEQDGGLVFEQIEPAPGERVRFVLESDAGQILLTDYAWCGKHWDKQNARISVWLPTEE